MNCVLFAKMDQVFQFKKTKNTGKWKIILEQSGNFVSPEKWDPCWIWIGVVAFLQLIDFTVILDAIGQYSQVKASLCHSSRP